MFCRYLDYVNLVIIMNQSPLPLLPTRQKRNIVNCQTLPEGIRQNRLPNEEQRASILDQPSQEQRASFRSTQSSSSQNTKMTEKNVSGIRRERLLSAVRLQHVCETSTPTRLNLIWRAGTYGCIPSREVCVCVCGEMSL